MDLISSTTAEPRRIGIFGKRYTYKHRYPPCQSNYGDEIVSSQETVQQNTLRNSNFVLREETSNEDAALSRRASDDTRIEQPRQSIGVIVNLNRYPSTTAQPRREGILGKRCSYKHRYPPLHVSDDYKIISSQEAIKQDMLSKPNFVQPEQRNDEVAISKRVSYGSKTKAEKRVNDLSDELLSTECENRDRDVYLNLLQKRLNIKPIKIDKLSLPDFPDIQRNDFEAFEASMENFLQARPALSDIQNIVNGLNDKISIGQILTSPPKSPSVRLSFLKEKILQSNLNPFSEFNFDVSPARSFCPVESNKQSDQADPREVVSSVMVEEDNVAVANESSFELRTESTHMLDKFVNKNSRETDVIIDGGSYYANIGDIILDNWIMHDNASGSNSDTDVQNTETSELEDKVGYQTDAEKVGSVMVETDNVVVANKGSAELEAEPSHLLDKIFNERGGDISVNSGSHCPSEDDNGDSAVDDWVMDDNAGGNDTDTDENSEPKEKDKEAEPDLNIDDSVAKELSHSCLRMGHSNHAIIDHADIGASETQHIGREQHTEGPSTLSLREQNKNRGSGHERRKRRKSSRGKSLAGAGMSWISGIRRSTRIKTRPLEYWKGERFIFGRIHRSLPTVIGLKYESPAKEDGKPIMKLKSFVSDGIEKVSS